jgi:NAD-dependent deacetylase
MDVAEDRDFDLKVSRVADLVAASKHIVVFTGAGISTESGLPAFRSPGGIWTRFDPDEFTIDKFIESEETRRKTWKFFGIGDTISGARPNKAHVAIFELEQLGRLDCVITQNIDYLHQKAGCPPEKVFELHGTMQWARCLNCGKRYDMELIRRRLKEADQQVPECDVCLGILKPDVIYFGEGLPQEALMKAVERAQNCDLFIIIGSSLTVYPAAYMPFYAVESGAKLVVINVTMTHCDDKAEVVIKSMAGPVMERVLTEVKKKIGIQSK